MLQQNMQNCEFEGTMVMVETGAWPNTRAPGSSHSIQICFYSREQPACRESPNPSQGLTECQDASCSYVEADQPVASLGGVFVGEHVRLAVPQLQQNYVRHTPSWDSKQ